MFGMFTQELRFAARTVRKNRLSSIASILALASGIGSITVVYAIVNAMVFRGLPVDHPDRIVRFTNGRGIVTTVAYRDVDDWRGLTTLAGIAAYRDMPMTVSDDTAEPQVFAGSYIEHNAFKLLDEMPIVGRDFTTDDSRSGAPPVVILAASLWKSRYNDDPNIIGRIIRINNVPSTVIGVMPDGFEFPLDDRLWQPLSLLPGLNTEKREVRTLRAFARLTNGVSLRQARAELSAVAARIALENPTTNRMFQIGLSPFTGDGTQAIYLWLFAAAGFVLLTACGSVAIILLVNSAPRAREMATRTALGATRRNVIGRLVLENAIVAGSSAILGLILAELALRLFAVSVEGINFPYWYRDRWTIDGRVFAFLTIVSVATGLLFSIAPAWHVSKTNLNELLKEGNRAGTGASRLNRWADWLSVAQVALTLVLLSGASLMMRSYFAIYSADRIVDVSRMLAASLRLTGPKYATPSLRVAFLQQLENRLNTAEEVASAAVMSSVPFVGGPTRAFAIDGRVRPGDAPPTVSYVAIGDRYFDTLGLSLVAGRPFNEFDGTAGKESAIVNRRFATLYFGQANPIGHRIRFNDANASAAGPWLTIVGISPTVRQQYLQDLDPVVYVPYRSDPGPVTWLIVKERRNSSGSAPLLRATLGDLDADLAFGPMRSMAELASQTRWAHRVFGAMFTFFALTALFISAMGLIAVTAFTVTRRTQEIGVRMALGAERSQILGLFIRGAAIKLGVGLAVGTIGAFVLGKLLVSLLVQTSSTDPISIVVSALVLVSIGAAACCVPAWQATYLDPALTLRHD